ncbi:Predicted DNA-binding transcriptional regulator YafY, contains an HTH and WYL domains [Paenibacillus sp. BC26]|nr:Predicted DNA-binding transcriptional regulator YafY, contains an HTH and WYL domains [Paenibacillus sp. BC26]
MSNMHRIRWFDSQIRDGKYPSSTQLAQQFEISKRQAQRDIEYLTYSLSAPLLYVAKYRGYCYENKTYALPLLYMTDEEKKVLKYLAYRYRQYNYDNAASVNRVAHLLERFSEEETEEPGQRLPIFETNPQLIHSFERLSYAIGQHLVVQVAYRDESSLQQLSIRPLKLMSQYNSDYVIAYCEEADKQRLLRLDGISSLDVTSARFEPMDAELLEWGAGGSSAAGSPQRKPYTAQVKLAQPLASPDSWQGYRIRSSTPEQALYTVEFHEIESFLHHLMGSAWEALLAPRWLREQLDALCRRTLERLGEGGTAKP